MLSKIACWIFKFFYISGVEFQDLHSTREFEKNAPSVSITTFKAYHDNARLWFCRGVFSTGAVFVVFLLWFVCTSRRLDASSKYRCGIRRFLSNEEQRYNLQPKTRRKNWNVVYDLNRWFLVDTFRVSGRRGYQKTHLQRSAWIPCRYSCACEVRRHRHQMLLSLHRNNGTINWS